MDEFRILGSAHVCQLQRWGPGVLYLPEVSNAQWLEVLSDRGFGDVQGIL